MMRYGLGAAGATLAADADRVEPAQPRTGTAYVQLGCRHRGDDHRRDADLLRTATPDGDELAKALLKLLDLKDAAHYGVLVVASRKARDAVRWSGRLVDRARQEGER
jgi:hypothetical protein